MDEELKLEVGDWVTVKDGKVVKITDHDMPDVPYESIERHATKSEILMNGGIPDDLELRMYFFVPYNIAPIQQGIQAGHSLGRYALKYGRYDPVHVVWDFLEKWETFIILNGGTTNSNKDFMMISVGSLNQIADSLVKNEIEMASMVEPDLNNALSAVAFICDERVFNKELYPEFWDFMAVQTDSEGNPEGVRGAAKSAPMEDWPRLYGQQYINWKEDIIGGDRNLFLRELVRNKKLA